MKHWQPRIYRTAPGFWGIGIHHSASRHWAVQFGPWVLTTEPELRGEPPVPDEPEKEKKERERVEKILKAERKALDIIREKLKKKKKEGK